MHSDFSVSCKKQTGHISAISHQDPGAASGCALYKIMRQILTDIYLTLLQNDYEFSCSHKRPSCVAHKPRCMEIVHRVWDYGRMWGDVNLSHWAIVIFWLFLFFQISSVQVLQIYPARTCSGLSFCFIALSTRKRREELQTGADQIQSNNLNNFME